MRNSAMYIGFEWEDPGGAKGAELRATWARLQITVAGNVVTRVEDAASRGVREGVYGPLYPIAEWIAANWWSLLHEVPSPSRERDPGYWRRHNLAAAAEGFALPSLWFRPEGSRVLLDWRSTGRAEQRVRFLGGGAFPVGRDELADTLGAFVRDIIHRLREEGVADSFLEQEWAAIESADTDERAFCIAAGRLGVDPYAPGGEDGAEALIHAAESMPASVLEEFLAVTDYAHIHGQSAALAEFLEEAGASNVELTPLRALRDELRGAASEGEREALPREALPWEQGYRLAGRVRDVLKPSLNEPMSAVETLGRALGLDAAVWRSAVTEREWTFLNAAVGENAAGSPYFALAKTYETGRVFSLCRALCEYLSVNGSPGAIVTRAYSERQKRNRAFAAEFIAPAARLREAIEGPVVTGEDVEALAHAFGASEFVIRHQIQNNGLAEIAAEF